MLKLPKRKKTTTTAAPKPSFNFKTKKRAVSSPSRVVPELEFRTKEELVHAWKVLHSKAKKKKLGEYKELFEDVKMYLKTKFHVEVPR